MLLSSIRFTLPRSARIAFGILSGALLGGLAPVAAEADDSAEEDTAAAVQLTGPERFRYEGYPVGLRLEDLNGDGRLDIFSYDSGRSLMTILYSERDAETAPKEFRLDNSDDWVWRPTQIVVTVSVTTIEAGDLDGDGRTDLALASSQGRGLVYYQEEGGLSETPVTLDQKAERLSVADLNGDGRDDLLLAEGDAMEVLLQDAEGNLQAYEKISVSAAPHRSPFVRDVNGDGIADLVYTESGKPQNLIVRLGEGDGRFGAEMPFEIDDNIDLRVTEAGKLAYIEPNTRALKVAALRRDGRDQLLTRAALASAEIIPLPGEIAGGGTDAISIPLAGGATGLLVSMADGAELMLLHRPTDGRLTTESIPSLAGIVGMSLARHGGGDDVVLLSEKESLIARLRLGPDGEMRRFPSPLPSGDTPLAMAVSQANPASIYTISRPDDDEDEDLRINSSALVDAPSDAPRSGPLAEPLVLDDTADHEPQRLVAADLNNDGADDFAVFFEYEPSKIYLSDATNGAEQPSYAPMATQEGLKRGLLEDVKSRDFHVADVDADGRQEIAIARGNFLRVYHMDAANELTIETQLAPPGRSAGLIAPLSADLDGDGAPEILCLDEKENHLLVYHGQAEGGFGEPKLADIPDMRAIKLLAADWTGDGLVDVIVVGAKKLALLRGGDLSQRIETLHTRLTDIENGVYGQLFVAPFVIDGLSASPRDMIFVVESRENMLELIDVDAAGEIESLYRFKVFNTPRPLDDSQIRRMTSEPHDLKIGDIDNDGLEDIVVLAHQNVIAYRQTKRDAEAGAPDATEAAAADDLDESPATPEAASDDSSESAAEAATESAPSSPAEEAE